MIQSKETFNKTLNEFLNEANLQPKLSQQEENVLLTKMSMKTEEGKACIEKIVKANMRNIISVARLYEGKGLTADTIIKTCLFCLYEAADRYEPSMGYRYLILAYGYMHWHIQSAIRNKNRQLLDRIFNDSEEEETKA